MTINQPSTEQAPPPTKHRPVGLVILFIVLLVLAPTVSFLFSGGVMSAFGKDPEGYGMRLLAYTLVIVVFVIVVSVRKQWHNIGFRLPNRPWAVATIILAVLLIVNPFFVSGWQPVPIERILFLLLVALLMAASEELLFRGAILRLLAPWGMAPAVIVSSLLFPVGYFISFGGHGPTFTILLVVHTFLFGLMLALFVWRTGCIWIPILMHALWDYPTYLVPARSTAQEIVVTVILLVPIIYLAFFYKKPAEVRPTTTM